jgi:hypothetical protein
MNCREAIEDALREIGVVAMDETMSADQGAHGMRKLKRMLAAWNGINYKLWTTASQTLTLTTSASYTLSPVRPIRILNANIVQGGNETPMHEMTRQEYDELPQKASTGVPISWYYDRQTTAALFYVWPVLASADGETVKITYERTITAPAELTDTTDVPAEMEGALVYNLAIELAPAYERPVSQDLRGLATAHLEVGAAGEREGSVFFFGDEW